MAMLWAFGIGFVIGMLVEFVYLVCSNKYIDTAQSCANCKYVRQAGGTIDMRFCCGHPQSVYQCTDVKGSWTCGHFDFTDTIKERVFRAKLSKMKDLPVLKGDRDD